MTLQDKVAVVTGGAQGLGEAICRRLASEGAHVVIVFINQTATTETAETIAADTGRRTLAVKADVTSEEEVAAMMDIATETFGRVDIVVSNAGVLVAAAIDEFPAEKWRFVMNVDLFGYFLVAKHAARVMKPQRSGSIIQINSKSGKKGSYKNSAYAAAKFGGIGLTQSIALELAEFNIRANAICPGNLLDSPLWVNSLYAQYAKKWSITEEEVRQRYIDQVPMKRGCTYEDISNVVVFLASDHSGYMTGQALNVTGGQQMH